MQLNELLSEFQDNLFSDHLTVDMVEPKSFLSIYKNNIHLALRNHLLNTYPLINALIGQETFYFVADGYIKKYPSRDSNIHAYGSHFAAFLKTQSTLNKLPYLSDIAEFEWIAHQLYFAADASSFNIASLAMLSEDKYPLIHCTLHPASALLSCRYPLLDIIALCKGETTGEININQGGVDLLIIRREFEIMLSPLTEAEFHFLTILKNDGSLKVALEEALVFDENFNLENKLPGWIRDKTIVNLFIC